MQKEHRLEGKYQANDLHRQDARPFGSGYCDSFKASVALALCMLHDIGMEQSHCATHALTHQIT